MHTHRQTDTLITTLRSPIVGGVQIVQRERHLSDVAADVNDLLVGGHLRLSDEDVTRQLRL